MSKNILILIGVLSLSYIIIFLLAPRDVVDYTVADTKYWRETDNRLPLKTVYDYNNKDSIGSFPKIIGEWKSFDYRYPEFVYTKLNADILMSRAYKKDDRNIVWMDIINSKTGESFHKQKICVEGSGWNVDNESVAEFNMANGSNPFTKLYANRLDITKKDKKQVMIYWFMFKKFGQDDSVTMIRLSTPVKNNESEKAFSLMKEFVEKGLFNTMYKSTEPENITNVEYFINKYGNRGIFAIIMILLIPSGIIVTGIGKKK